jgi:outer membrane biosynthesis protein TonB
MTYWPDESSYRHEAVTVRTLWLTIALSLLIHFGALLWLPQVRLLTPGEETQELAADRLEVRLAALSPPPPAQTPTPAPSPAIVAAPKPPARPPRTALRTRPPPVLIAPIPEAPAIPAPLPTPAPATPPATAPPRTSPPPPLENDLWSYIQARRRERGEQQAAPIAKEGADLNARIAANMPAPATGVATRNSMRGGGIFEIKRMNYDDAAFEFFGWNNEMGRKTPQLIEVRKGDNTDMRIAVVRKMIAIIREYSKDDFVWRSPHHADGISLSARVSDNAHLENFLMHDFFDDPRQLQ